MTTTAQWPAGLVARPIGKADVPAWAELMAAKEQADAAGENYDADDLLEELADPRVDPAEDTIGVWSGDRMAGYGVVRSAPVHQELHRVRIEGAVHPQWRRRGLGTALLAWFHERSVQVHAEHPGTAGEINTSVISTNTGADQLLTAAGYVKCRYFFHLERPLDTPVDPSPVPAGFRLVPFDPAYDEPLRLTRNEVFADHWGSTPRDAESWRTWFTGTRSFRPGASYLVLDGDTIAAYVLGYEWPSDTEATGIRELYIGNVGTRRPYRGRGLAHLIMSRQLADAAAVGYQRAALGVNADNATGALGLYERLGFGTAHTSVTYRLPLPG